MVHEGGWRSEPVIGDCWGCYRIPLPDPPKPLNPKPQNSLTLKPQTLNPKSRNSKTSPKPTLNTKKSSTSSIPTLETLLHEKCNVSMRPQIVFFAALQLRCKTVAVLALHGQMLWGSALQGLGRTRTLCH